MQGRRIVFGITKKELEIRKRKAMASVDGEKEEQNIQDVRPVLECG